MRPVKTEDARRLASWDAGFGFAWPVFARYRARGGILREEGREWTMIAAAAEPDLLTSLANVGKSEAGIKPEEFASQFGLLGYSHVCEPEKRCGGDPIPWFRAHAKAVAVVLDLVSAVSQKDSNEIDWLLSRIRQGFLPKQRWPDNPVRAAQETVEIIINSNIDRIVRQLRLRADGTLCSVFKPRALIDVVWWKLADLAEGRSAVRRCRGCGALFIGQDPRRLYCPGKTCAVSRRVRLFRERQKEGKNK